MNSASLDEPSTVTVTSDDGARVTMHHDGAHVTSWIPSGTTEDQLFLSARSAFGRGASIRGGVPVIFPQFASEGPLPKHGFARTTRWSLRHVEQRHDGARVEMELRDDDITRAIWPHAFRALLALRVGGTTLDIGLTIDNTDSASFTFTAALHSYFRVRDAYRTDITGLSGTRYRDALQHRTEDTETHPSLAILGEIDRVYFDVAGPLAIREPERGLRIVQYGFRDVVVWNPGENGLRGKTDFEAGEERHMLCVESAAVQHPITLQPGEQWVGQQLVTAVPSGREP